ncbi:hypothetical protein NQ318_019742 [Aromia moschata]|uniref:Uncharacterized protein n=1 Tax=Aromia moschata TaxID=1265417 RepID=A0AAV8XHV6_9CUCU|nr:hypothetical protein NQ318_019742 [Aromia moschata]
MLNTPEKDELMKAEVDRKRGKKRDVKNKKIQKRRKNNALVIQIVILKSLSTMNLHFHEILKNI